MSFSPKWGKSRSRTEPAQILNVALSLNSLAVLYAEQGRKYVTAERLFKYSLCIRERHLGPDHPDVALSLSNLANVYAQLGRYDDAEQLYKRSLGIFEQSRGSTHSDMAYPLNGLAILYAQQGKYREAEKLYERSRSIWEQVLGPDHSQVAYSLNNLAVLYAQQAQVIFKKKLGSEHPHTQMCTKKLESFNTAGYLFCWRTQRYLARFDDGVVVGQSQA